MATLILPLQKEVQGLVIMFNGDTKHFILVLALDWINLKENKITSIKLNLFYSERFMLDWNEIFLQ
jgi:hypothetical protein